MEALMQPEKLRTRILLWAEEEIRLGTLPAKSGNILEVVLYRGELPGGDAAAAVGATDRHARRIVSALMIRGVLKADGARAPLRLVFPAALASRWMPGLFPERTVIIEKKLEFPAPEPRYIFDREVVAFWGLDGDKRIRCEITEEALDDHFGGDRKDEVKAFVAHEREIEGIARRRCLAGKTEPDGSVLIRTLDL